MATDGVFVHASWIAVAHDGDVAVCMAEFEGCCFVLEAVCPVAKDEAHGWEHDCGFEFCAVAEAVEVFEGGADAGEDSAWGGTLVCLWFVIWQVCGRMGRRG